MRIPGQVVTTDALQRLCITHVQTKRKEKRKVSGEKETFDHWTNMDHASPERVQETEMFFLLSIQ